MKQFLALAGLTGVAALEDRVVLDSALMRAHVKEVVETMPKAQAMAAVKKKASPELLNALQMAKLKKETAQEAVTTLNNMYLESEEELDEKMFECVAERANYHQRIAQISKEISLLSVAEEDAEGAATTAENDMSKAAQEENNTQDTIDALVRAYNAEYAIDAATRDELKTTLDAMSFILEIAQCKDAPALMLNQNMDQEQYKTCAKQNADNDMYLVNLFSNPEVERRVDEELNGAQHAKLQAILGFKQTRRTSTGADDDVLDEALNDDAEDADAAPAFIQRRSANDDDSWKSCDGVEPDCAIMTEKVGGMYGDARDAYDRHMALMAHKETEFKEEKEDLETTKESLITEKMMAGEEMTRQTQEKTVAKTAKDLANSRLRDEQRELDELWSACKTDIKKIMYDGVCSVLNVRKNVVDGAKKALNVNPDKLAAQSDCSVTEWTKDGKCSRDCVNRKKKPTDEVWDDLIRKHVQKWVRSPVTSCDEGDEKNKDACAVALPCPNTMERDSTCNKFLCPVDCEVTKFSAWSSCSKECDNGIQIKSRQVVQRPQYGGSMCDVLSETQKCGDSPCDKDCVLRGLRSSEWRKTPCVRGCKIRSVRDDPDYSGSRNRPMKYSWRRIRSVRGVAMHAKGRGKCPKKWSAARVTSRACRAPGSSKLMQRCNGDEMCTAKMDFAVAFDSSGGIGENGHETIKDFVKQLLAKFTPHYFDRPATAVGIVQFGNGKLIKKTTNGVKVTVVQPAKQLTNGPTNDFRLIEKTLAEAKWQKGFTNIAQALLVSCGMLQRRGRSPGGAFQKKVIIVTGSAPTLEFASQQAAGQQCKDKGIVVDFVVINDKFSPANADWEVLRGGTSRIDDFSALPSYPPKAHIHHINGMNDLVMKPKAFAKKLIPKVCPLAQSPRSVVKRAAKGGYLMVTRGKDCGNWWRLVGRFKSPKACAAKIRSKQMKGKGKKRIRQFVFQGANALRSRGVYPCYTHNEGGVVHPYKPNKFPDNSASDKSCSCTSLYCTGKVKGGKPGWLEQRQIMSKNSGAFSRYATVDPKKLKKRVRRKIKKPFTVWKSKKICIMWHCFWIKTPVKKWKWHYVVKLVQKGDAVTQQKTKEKVTAEDDKGAAIEHAKKVAYPYDLQLLKSTGMTEAELEASDREIGENLDDSMQDEGIAVDSDDLADALEDVNFRRMQETARII